MTTAIRSPSNTPIVWVARKVNDFLEDTVHSDRVRKSRRYSDQLVSGENSSAFGKQTWRIGSCSCTGRLLRKKCELCPGHPLLCSGGLCDGFFLLTLQERVILGQNGRETNKKNNHLANLAPEEFHTCLFSTHPRLWYLSPTLKWPQLFNTIKAKVTPDLNLEASVRAVTFISPRVLPWSSLACVLTWSLFLFSWVLFSLISENAKAQVRCCWLGIVGSGGAEFLEDHRSWSLQCEGRRWMFAARNRSSDKETHVVSRTRSCNIWWVYTPSIFLNYIDFRYEVQQMLGKPVFFRIPWFGLHINAR